MCCCNEDRQTESHVKNVVMNVSRGLRRENDSVRAIGLEEVGEVDEESNVMNSDECTKEVQHVFDSISVAEFDTRVLRESTQTDIDFVDQFDVYRERPRRWASSISVIPTKWVDEGSAKQLEYCSRLCEKEVDRFSSNVKCVTVDVMSRKIMV